MAGMMQRSKELPGTRYIALLRGINVGGNKQIRMADLRALFVSLGFENVQTALASGNAAFDAESADRGALQAVIEGRIESTFGFPVSVIVMTRQHVETLVKDDPFAGINVTEDTYRYVTFLPEAPDGKIDLPYHTPGNDFTILRATDREVYSVLTLSPAFKTTDSMKVLETLFGKNITTRNWNTVLKIAEL
jgi:uncharacterized protein (DUF1697 family)